jgi:NTP pyrophosphatase (non-canonical NTP hydrolase)|tara:strand:- start:41 stop:364 length:324 start_codon:yes stop_codon:yes gene_type:complete
MIKDNDDELMVITMEECGELIQACSKAMRTREYSSQQLTEEVGDVMCMVGLLMQYGLIDEEEVEARVNVKLAKLAKWSYLVEDKEEYKEIRNDNRRRSTKRGNRTRR